MPKTNDTIQSEQEEGEFAGFDIPKQNYFKMPDSWTNLTSHMASLAEVKVVEYVLKHTWGFHEYGQKKRITLDEFQHGRKRSDGTRMDEGIGMHKQAIRSGLKAAQEHGFLEHEVDGRDKARIKKYYGLKMRPPDDDPDKEDSQPHLVQRGESHTPEGLKSPINGVKTTYRSEKDTSERDFRKTVNGVKEIQKLKDMPNLDEPSGKINYVASHILSEMGDAQSEKFYHLVAAKVPESVVFKMIAEVKADGARNPGATFTFKVKAWVLEQQKKSLVDNMGHNGIQKWPQSL